MVIVVARKEIKLLDEEIPNIKFRFLWRKCTELLYEQIETKTTIIGQKLTKELRYQALGNELCAHEDLLCCTNGVQVK